MRLRIEVGRGAPVNEYRLLHGKVQFRMLDPSGRPYSGSASAWRTLDDNDIQLHHALGTVVSKWLRVRLAEADVDDLGIERAA